MGSPTLPLLYHSLELVVQDHDLDTDTVLRSSLELHRRHAKRCISVDVDDGLVRSADLGTNGRWQTEAHRLQSCH